MFADIDSSHWHVSSSTTRMMPAIATTLTWEDIITQSVVVGVVNVISATACIALLRKVRRLGALQKQHLFIVQIRHLAIADLVAHVCLIPYTVFYLGRQCNWVCLGMSPAVGDYMCGAGEKIFIFPIFASVFFEMHLCMGFISQAMHWLRAIKLLRSHIIAIWPIALIWSFVGVLLHQTDASCLNPSRDVLYVSTLLLAFCFCFAGYVVTAAMVCQSVPLSVHKLTWKRAMVYPLNFLICYSLTILGNLPWTDLWDIPGYVLIDHSLLGLTGAANALAYFWQSRYARNSSEGWRRSSQSDSIFRSFHVGFANAEVLPVDFESLHAESSAGSERPGPSTQRSDSHDDNTSDASA